MRGVPRLRRAISHAPCRRSRPIKDAGRPADDGLQLVVLVVVEPGDEPEPVAQRAGDHPGAGRGADERERRQREPDRRCRRPLADHDVELEVLHRRVQDLLDGTRQTVDLVDEQHVAVAELGEDRRQVAGSLQRRAGGDVHLHAHLGRDDAGQRRLAEPWRAGEQEVIDRLAAAAGRPRARSLRCSFSSRWPTNSASRRGRRPISSTLLHVVVDVRDRGTPHARRAPSSWRASRNIVAASSPAAIFAQGVADLVRGVPEPEQRLPDVAER